MNRRALILSSAAALTLLAACAVAYAYMDSRRQAAGDARQDLTDCRQVAAQIRKYSQRPTLAAEKEERISETTVPIEKAAKSAGIPKIAYISPEPAQRLGDSPYKEKPTQVRLEEVSLEQVVRILHELAGSNKSLHPKALRLTSPRESNSDHAWTVELTLTYLIYDPIKPEK